jgi:hypothetical protein
LETNLMAKTTSKKVLTALPMLALAAVPTVSGIAPAFAAEATTATTTLNGTLANSSLKVTGGEGPVQTLTNGRGGVTRQVTLTIPNLDGALKAGQTTEIELIPTLAAGSEGKENAGNLLFTTKMVDVLDASGKKIGTLSNHPTNSRIIRITWNDAITENPRDISANFTANIDPLNDEKVVKTYDLKYKATGIGTVNGGQIKLNPAATQPNFIAPGGVWYGGQGVAKCGVPDAFLKGQTVPNGVVKGGTYEIELVIDPAKQQFRIGQGEADDYLKKNPNFAMIPSLPAKEIGGRWYLLQGKELAQWGKDNPDLRKYITVVDGMKQDEWLNGTYDVDSVSEKFWARAATGVFTDTVRGELKERGLTKPLVTIDFEKSTPGKLVLKYTALWDGMSFWFSTTSPDVSKVVEVTPDWKVKDYGPSIDAEGKRCGDVQLTAQAIRNKETVFTFESRTYRTDVAGRPQTGFSPAWGGYSYEDGSAEAYALPKDGNEQKQGAYGVPLVADLMENSSTVKPYTLDKSKTVFANTDGATISEGGKKIVVPGKATITIDDKGVATAVPEKGFSGTVTVNYNIFDSGKATTKVPSNATFTWAKQSSLAVSPAEKTIQVNSEKSHTLDPLATAKVEGSTIDASTLKLGAGAGSTSYKFGDSGVTAKVVNGKVVFDHPQNVVGDFTVRYVVSTADGKEAESTVTLHIQPVNTAIGIVTKIDGDDANVNPVKLKLDKNGSATGKVTVELTNTSGSAVTLNGDTLSLANAAGTKVTLPAGFTLAPGETKTIEVGTTSVASGKTTEVVYSATQTANIFKRWDGTKVSGTVGTAQTVTDPAKATAEVVSEVPGNPPVVADNPEATYTEPKASDDSYTITTDETVLEGVLSNDKGGSINGVDDPLDAKTIRFQAEDGSWVTSRTFEGKGTYTVDDNGVVKFLRAAGYTGELPEVTYQVSTVSGLSTQAVIRLEHKVEPPVTPEAPKPEEPKVEKPAEPVKQVEAKTGHDTANGVAGQAGLFAAIGAGLGALFLGKRRKGEQE